MIRKFLFAVAILAISINPVAAQGSKQPVEPASTSKVEAPKPLSYKIGSMLPELKDPLDAVGEQVFPKGAEFPTDVGPLDITIDDADGKPVTIRNTMVSGKKPLGRTLKVKGNFKIPVGTVFINGFELTLSPSTPLPTPAKPPERVTVGIYDFTKEELANNPMLMAELLMQHDKRIAKAEQAIKGLAEEMKAKRLTLKPNGKLLWTYDSKKQPELNGSQVVFRYEWRVCNDPYIRYVYECLE